MLHTIPNRLMQAPQNARGIADILRKIVESIRNTYTLTYVSTNTARDGRFRTVRVAVISPSGPRLLVRTRVGYMAGEGPGGP